VRVKYLPSFPRKSFFAGFCRLLFPLAIPDSFIFRFLQPGDSHYFSEPTHFCRQDLFSSCFRRLPVTFVYTQRRDSETG